MKHFCYSFNSETFTYERIHFCVKGFVRSVGYAVLCGLVCGALLVGYLSFNNLHLEDNVFAERNSMMVAKINVQTEMLANLQASLNDLHLKDNSYYRSILNMDKIDPSLWNGGTGGSDRFSVLQPTVLQTPSILLEKLSYQTRLQVSSFDALEKIAEEKSEELRHVPAIRPLNGYVVSGFGYRRAAARHTHAEFHPGIDFDADTGTPVRSTGAGVIITSGAPESGYGIQIVVDHGFGYKTRYAHLSKVAVTAGQQVKRGEVIGYSGNTGYSTGPHLHYEVIRHSSTVNPYDFFYATSADMDFESE